MSLPAMWIRKNMLQSPSPNYSKSGRLLTEAEIKVQRSLQKLEIPEWYLNNNSRPPKILMNDTPIESRRPLWKEQRLNKTFVCSTPEMPVRNLTVSTVNRNGLLETEIGAPETEQFGTYKINRSTTTERSLVGKKRCASSQKSQVMEKNSSRSRLVNVSRTFPRVSPSRKIANINIVFPQPSVDSRTITDIDHDESQLNATKDSSEPIASPNINDEDLEASSLRDASPKSKSSGTKVLRMPNQRLTYITPWKPLSPSVTPVKKFSSDRCFTPRASSVPQRSQNSSFLDSVVDHSLPKQNKMPATTTNSFAALEASKEIGQPPPITPGTIKPMPSNEKEICDACKADASKRTSLSPHSRPSSGRSFRAIDARRPNTPRLRASAPTSVASPCNASFASKKKPSELGIIVEQKQPQQDINKSLVQEIIEELNEKCGNSTQPTYVTPGSKNFVKKLVKALEKGTLSRSVAEETQTSCQHFVDYPEDDDETESSEHGSDDDTKSVAVSTSISYKDSDSSNSSDSELRSPTMKQNYNYDWNMNVQKNTSETTTAASETIVPAKEEDSVYWIHVPNSKLPRSSSLLSMISRLSTNSPRQQSPCLSPIRPNNAEGKYQNSINAWGLTCRTSDYARTLRRIDETTILDSGYSDRSRRPSSDSSDDTWLDDTEATQTASETGSCNSFSTGSYPRRSSRTQLLRRPFVI